ncbi:hypothetical protein CC86DRAFT_386710 [Ophiobolus disseminans]|uniref:Uncharacterized protein n=1 Tax=Ophiobolus disseminans TaxID=1469910 RepID=A0A6A6ZLG5_9PLEO|nr:hypothetical protein CC86DRAFT_386710 [Ophiobolus disseminans]
MVLRMMRCGNEGDACVVVLLHDTFVCRDVQCSAKARYLQCLNRAVATRTARDKLQPTCPRASALQSYYSRLPTTQLFPILNTTRDTSPSTVPPRRLTLPPTCQCRLIQPSNAFALFLTLAPRYNAAQYTRQTSSLEMHVAARPAVVIADDVVKVRYFIRLNFSSLIPATSMPHDGAKILDNAKPRSVEINKEFSDWLRRRSLMQRDIHRLLV